MVRRIWVKWGTDSFADVSVGPTELQSKDRPSLPPKIAEKKRVAVVASVTMATTYTIAEPLQAFIGYEDVAQCLTF